MDSILTLMIKHKIPLTLANYVHIAWMGDKTVEDLDPEELAEIPEEIVTNTKWVM
jgi:hypothetical protein